jgi:flagellin-like hook-associated protein FlgL
MVSSVNTNGGAMVALATLRAVAGTKDRVAKQLETGYKVADFSDDAAVFAVAQSVRATQKARLAVDTTLARTVMALETASAGINRAFRIMSELQTKIVQAGDGSLSDEQRRMIDNDYQAYLTQLDHAAQAAVVDGVNLIGGDPPGATIEFAPQISLRAAPGVAPPMPAPDAADTMPANPVQAVPNSGETVFLGLPIRLGNTPTDAIAGEVRWLISIDGAVQALAPPTVFQDTGLVENSVYYLGPVTSGFAAGPEAVTLPTIPDTTSNVRIYAELSLSYPPSLGRGTPGYPTEITFANYHYFVGNSADYVDVLEERRTPGDLQFFPRTQVRISGGDITGHAPRGLGGGTSAITTSPVNVDFTPINAVPPYPASGTEEILFDIRVYNSAGTLVAVQTDRSTGAGGTSWSGTLNYEQLVNYQNANGDSNRDSFTVSVSNVRYTERDQPPYTSQSADGASSLRAVFVTSTWVNDAGPTLEPSIYQYGENEDGQLGILVRSNLTAMGLALEGTSLLSSAAISATRDAFQSASLRLAGMSAYYASEYRGILQQSNLLAELRAAAEKALGVLIDADVAEAGALLRSEEVREQLAINALNIANRQPSLLLSLLR